MIKIAFAALQDRLDKNRRYRKLITEIASLNARDLQELRADPIEMRQQAHRMVYGHRISPFAR